MNLHNFFPVVSLFCCEIFLTSPPPPKFHQNSARILPAFLSNFWVFFFFFFFGGGGGEGGTVPPCPPHTSMGIYCPRLTKLVRGLWNGLRTCVRACVRASVCAFVHPGSKCWNLLLLCHFFRASGLKMLKFASSLSFLGWFWFCLFYLMGLGAGFKLLHRILKFINYANLCKFIQNQWKMLLLSFLGRFWFCLFYLIGLGAGFKTSTQNFEIH